MERSLPNPSPPGRTPLPKHCRGLEFVGLGWFGSVESFFHFMWGYLLPAVHLMLQRQPGEAYAFRSCGPVMDPLIAEVCRTFDVDGWSIPADHLLQHPSREAVPRWDVGLMRPYLLNRIPTSSKNIAAMQRTLRTTQLWGWLQDPGFPSRFEAAIQSVRSAFLGHLQGLRPELQGLADTHLILRRSAEPAFYAPGGGAWVDSYGTTRRALLGIDESVAPLRAAGISVAPFEPGRHTLLEQVAVFHHCRSIVAIRGAELANLIWMRPGSRVVVIIPRCVRYIPPPHLELARLLQLDLHHIFSEEDAYPELEPDVVGPLLED